MIIRNEISNDIKAIEDIILAAFTGLFSDNPTEHLVINELRKADALSLSLVAEVDEKVIGHVAFSKVTIDGVDKGWYGLGPISVLPAWQRQGVGSALIYKGLAKLRTIGAGGCVLEGSPDYYQCFGFKSYPELVYELTPSPKYFMALPFGRTIPNGIVEYHKAFYVQA